MTREKLKKLIQLDNQIKYAESQKFQLSEDSDAIEIGLPCRGNSCIIRKEEDENLFNQAFELLKKLNQRDSDALIKLKEQFESEKIEEENKDYNPHISQPEEIKFNIKTEPEKNAPAETST